MNPDKLFDYLDGKLPEGERRALEQRLVSDEQLRRELAVARQIHAHGRGDSREIILPGETDTGERGRALARRIGVVFIILMALNVGVGLWFIARQESKNPNRALLQEQMRRQLAESLERAAASALSPAPLGVTEIRLSIGAGQLDAVTEKVVDIVRQLGGTVTKGMPDPDRIGLLVDLPGNQEGDFRRLIAAIPATSVTMPPPDQSSNTDSGGKSFAVEIVESSGPK